MTILWIHFHGPENSRPNSFAKGFAISRTITIARGGGKLSFIPPRRKRRISIISSTQYQRFNGAFRPGQISPFNLVVESQPSNF
jgi:hypothetical protein